MERGGIVRGGDDEDIGDTRQNKGGQRVVDHGFVIYGGKLLARAQRNWM